MTRRTQRRTLLRGAALSLVTLAAACSDEDTGGSSRTPTDSASPSPSSSGSASPQPSSQPSTPSPTQTPSVSPRVAGTVADGIAVPWGIVFLSGGDALVSSRDTGEVLLVAQDGGSRAVGTVPGVVSRVDESGEGGLLGLALHPGFTTNGLLYAYHSTADDNRVVRMTYGGTLGQPEIVLDGIATSIHHNGGGLVFGPDEMLYVSTGDAEDTAHAQDTDSLNGKVLRLTETGARPDGNPFDNLVWSYGHRNVEGLAFDTDGRPWASEFGDKGADELNHIVAGANYGWPDVEGSDGKGGYADPLAQWEVDDCSPSGIAVAAGRAWLGALQCECVYSVVLAGHDAGRVDRFFEGEYGRIRSVATAPDGSLWVGTSNRDGRAEPRDGDDRLLRVTL